LWNSVRGLRVFHYSCTTLLHKCIILCNALFIVIFFKQKTYKFFIIKKIITLFKVLRRRQCKNDELNCINLCALIVVNFQHNWLIFQCHLTYKKKCILNNSSEWNFIITHDKILHVSIFDSINFITPSTREYACVSVRQFKLSLYFHCALSTSVWWYWCQ
jgi:hypothetical protein